MSGKENADLVDETGRNSLDPKHAPQSLPATSFDVVALQKGLETAVKGAEKNREANVASAIENAAADKDLLKAVDGAAQIGYELVEVKRDDITPPHADDVVEEVRVYKPGKEAETAATDAPNQE
jgi:hypothetical protein